MEAILNPLTQAPIADEKLKSLADLARQQVVLQQRIEKGEELLAKLNEELKVLQTQRIPDAMAEIGMESFSLSDGTAITVEPFYSASIPKERQDEAFQWLRDNDYDSIIKRNIVITFGKGEDGWARKFMADLAKRKKKVIFENKQTVHPQTLKAFVREKMEAGENLPEELLGVFVGKKAKITPATK